MKTSMNIRMNTSTTELTLFFDGNCPFCAAEMHRLAVWDKAHNKANPKLAFVDIAKPDFDIATTGVSFADLDRELHSRTAEGVMLIGLDSMQRAYTLVGRAHLVFLLQFKSLRPLLSRMYLGFAANRYRFSKWLGYGKREPICDGTVCRSPLPFMNAR